MTSTSMRANGSGTPTSTMTGAATTRSMSSTGTPSGALLSVRDLRVGFRNRTGVLTPAVAALSMDVPVGGSVAVVGESGSGKTVSMRAMLQVLPETAEVSGEAVFDGQELIGLPEPALRRVRGPGIGMVFQNAMSALNPTRTLKVQLTEHLRWNGICNRAEAKKRAVQALDRVGIPDPDKRIRMYPFQLSGGQRQRAMIAMAIVAGPRLLIADEPTTALDVTVQRQVLDVLKQLREDGLAMVMITHDLGVAKYMCDDVVVMRHGHVVETAPMRIFVGGARHEYSRQLLDAALDIHTDDDQSASDTDTDADADNQQAGSGAGGDKGTSPADSSPGLGVPRERVELVRVADLVKVFQGRGGDVRAVAGASLVIARGETLGVVGESGSGKSTLARLIMRLVEPTAGSVDFDGTDVLAVRGPGLKAWRRRAQMVFQNPYSSLLPHLSVAANVYEPLRVHNVGGKAERRARAVELLELVGIPADRVDQYPRQFSGGQQQRVAIARALALEPELLVCDEPTSALDVSIQAQVLELLEELQDRLGLSMLFITHNLAVAQRLCDRILVMAAGHIVETAPTSQLFAGPQHPYTRALLGAVLPIHSDPAPSAIDADAVDVTGELTETTPGHWIRLPTNGAREM